MLWHLVSGRASIINPRTQAPAVRTLARTSEDDLSQEPEESDEDADWIPYDADLWSMRRTSPIECFADDPREWHVV